MKIPEPFLRYFALVTLVLLLGIAVPESALAHPALVPYNATALQARYLAHAAVVVPRMPGIFPLLLFANAGVALFLLFVPLYWAGIWWFRRDLLDRVLFTMRGPWSC